MIQAQTDGRNPVNGWMRDLPTEDMAKAFEEGITRGQEASAQKDKSKSVQKRELLETTVTALMYGRPDDDRLDASGLMGKKSANAVSLLIAHHLS